jgi:hypothetical protein
VKWRLIFSGYSKQDFWKTIVFPSYKQVVRKCAVKFWTIDLRKHGSLSAWKQPNLKPPSLSYNSHNRMRLEPCSRCNVRPSRSRCTQDMPKMYSGEGEGEREPGTRLVFEGKIGRGLGLMCCLRCDLRVSGLTYSTFILFCKPAGRYKLLFRKNYLTWHLITNDDGV